MKKTKIHPLFIAYIILLVIMGQASSVLVYFLCVAPHEIAHAYVAKRLGYKLQKFSLMPYGVCLNYNTNCFYNNDEILIAIAGPIANISLAILTTALWWIFPTTYALTHQFCFANLVIFMFNILPCYPLDGGRVLVGFLNQKMSRKKSIKIALLFNIATSLLFVFAFILGIFYGKLNFNLIIIALFLFAGIIDPQNMSKYEYIKYKKNPQSLKNKALKVKSICISAKMPIYKLLPKLSKNKYNVVYVLMKNTSVKIINENTIEQILQKHLPTSTFEQIFALYN